MAHFPRDVYLIFTYNNDGNVNGVYVGSSTNVVNRLKQHIFCGKNDHQKDLHSYMKTGNYFCIVVDSFDHVSSIEYEWIRFFEQMTKIPVFNISKDKMESKKENTDVELKRKAKKIIMAISKAELFGLNTRNLKTIFKSDQFIELLEK